MKNQIFRYWKNFTIIILLLSNSNCAYYENVGYNFNISSFDKLQPEVTSKDRVFEMMGSPSFVYTHLNQELWAYYSQKDRNFLFFKPKTISRRLVIISFDNDNIIKKINDINKNKITDYHFVKKITKVPAIKKENIIFDIYNNIGQVRAN